MVKHLYYFPKYNDEWLEINLHFRIRVQLKNKKTRAIIRAKGSRNNNQYIKFEQGKEKDIDEEIKIIEYKMEINCGIGTDELIGFCECEIEGHKKSINIKKKF